jgi:hypothetical protein
MSWCQSYKLFILCNVLATKKFVPWRFFQSGLIFVGKAREGHRKVLPMVRKWHYTIDKLLKPVSIVYFSEVSVKKKSFITDYWYQC